MSSQKDSEENSSLPSFPVRWFMLFRRYPLWLLDFRFLYGVISQRSPVLWVNFMKGEKLRRLKTHEKPVTETPKTVRPKEIWRDEELAQLWSSDDKQTKR